MLLPRLHAQNHDIRPGSLGVRTQRCTRVSAAAPTARQPQQQQPPPPGAPGQLVSLKEWAVTAAALGAGEQTILLRKGGIQDPRFVPEAQQFLLFPTSFHTEQQLLKPGVAERYAAAMALEPKEVPSIPLGVWCEVTGAWTTEDARIMQALDPLHVYTDAFLEGRLKWRSRQPLTLLEVRAYRLEPPLALARTDDLFGCFSWLPLPQLSEGGGGGAAAAAAAAAAALRAKVPALDDGEFARRQAALRERLAGVDAAPLEL